MGLYERLLEAREFGVDLGDGKTLTVRRPLASQLPKLRSRLVESAHELVVGWSGITEADLLGPSIGSTTEAPFDPQVCAEALGDRPEWAAAVVERTIDVVTAYIKARESALKK